MKYIIYPIVFVVIFFGKVSAGDSINADWIIYLAVGPEAYKELGGMAGSVSFPLYIGYIYSEKSEYVVCVCKDDTVCKKMNELANKYSKYVLIDEYIMPEDGSACCGIEDEKFPDAVMVDLFTKYSIRPVRFERNVRVDDDWIPEFDKKYTFTNRQTDIDHHPQLVSPEAFRVRNWKKPKGL
jgi:hypothetical protein